MAVVEEINESKNEKKRGRVDSDYESDLDSPELKRVRDDLGEFEVHFPETKKIRDDLLEILDDSDILQDRDPEIQGLESVMKSFEEEIFPPVAVSESDPASLSDPGETQPDLGYLLEASDYDLGLPPTAGPTEETAGSVDILALASDMAQFEGVMSGFEDEIPSYDDSFVFGLPQEMPSQDFNSEFVTVDGLFEPSDVAEFLWRPESLPAL
ncbi:hypothetical protein Ancab_029129 [Ancistrocladus abbreviatus]